MFGRLQRLLPWLPGVFRDAQTVLDTPAAGAPSVGTAEPTVILGGGIIGLSTAYYLALAGHETASLNEPPRNGTIFVLDPSSQVCAGASGQNEGVFGDYGLDEEVAPLGHLSCTLHNQLADDHDGLKNYGYSGLKIHALFSNGYDPSNPRLPFPVKRQEELSELPSWIKVPHVWQAGLLSDSTESKRLDAPRFCQLLRDQCTRLGVQFLFSTRAQKVHTDAQNLALSHLEVKTEGEAETRYLPLRSLVIATGSWSGHAFAQLFPQSRVCMPMAEKQPAQNWLRVRNPSRTSEDTKADCDQVFLAPALDEDVDVHFSAFSGGDELYVGGALEYLNPPAPLPESVQLSPDDLKALKMLTAEYLGLDTIDSLDVLSSGRAYMPRTATDIPIITKIEWTDVYPSASEVQAASPGCMLNQGGVYLNLGHYLDGLMLGPASGKVMSELLTGKNTSVDLTAFSLPKHFFKD